MGGRHFFCGTLRKPSGLCFWGKHMTCTYRLQARPLPMKRTMDATRAPLFLVTVVALKSAECVTGLISENPEHGSL